MAITNRQRVLKVLREAKHPLTMLEISQRCGKVKSSGFKRVIQKLVEDELVHETRPKGTGNGRPAYCYQLKSKVKKQSLRQQWEFYCETEIPMDYITFLELLATGEIKLD